LRWQSLLGVEMYINKLETKAVTKGTKISEILGSFNLKENEYINVVLYSGRV